MSCWRIADDVATAVVVTAAIERFAKGPANPRQVESITARNWFTCASDLRVAIQNEAQWKTMELPIRLKLALEEVLGEWDAVVAYGVAANVGVPIAATCPDTAYYEATAAVYGEVAMYTWVCIKCSFENAYEDSFCGVCYEHYSVSVTETSDYSPTDAVTNMCPLPCSIDNSLPPPVPAEYY
ncbi:hypothetical protein ACHHYP_12050 [Achlya hypogyna]|uniref:RanBP2-type domain-containing protein n=1 Tax=Achlya hypogyna TaxID=1202772 RepID=A0A1V9YHT2_ACHHY|nr:hypothetical protein ACHHYP_12050 [Achlya hypogyna]